MPTKRSSSEPAPKAIKSRLTSKTRAPLPSAIPLTTRAMAKSPMRPAATQTTFIEKPVTVFVEGPDVSTQDEGIQTTRRDMPMTTGEDERTYTDAMATTPTRTTEIMMLSYQFENMTTMAAPPTVNGAAAMSASDVVIPKPHLELYVRASSIDPRRIGACLFCQEFWMELYALFELNLVRVEIKAVSVNSEAFKRNFLGAQPPIMVETQNKMTYSDNRELEGRIFHIAKDFHVPLFEKDTIVEKRIETLYRNFKVFLRAAVDERRGNAANGYTQPTQQAYQKLVDQLVQIDQLLKERNTRYLLGASMTEYDCELMPRLHHIRIAGGALAGFEIPETLVSLWNYMLTAYRTAAFLESCPADQDIVQHYKDQMSMLKGPNREALQAPTKTHTIPDAVLDEIKRRRLTEIQ